MEQKDYLLREIEKIGLMLRMIFNKLVPSDQSTAISSEEQLEQTRGLLLDEIGFDIDVCFSLEKSELERYISTINGINGQNLELLADILKVMGMKAKPVKQIETLECALKLYELCNSIEKTFSFDRDGKISEIKNIL